MISKNIPVYGYISIEIRFRGSNSIWVYNNSAASIEWRFHNGNPAITISGNSSMTSGPTGVGADGVIDYGDLYTKAGVYIGPANYGGGYQGNYVTSYTTQYSTVWNTKWKKLNINAI